MPVGARAKVRDEGLVVLWTVLTIGIWTLVWYYRINREMRDFGRSHGDEKLANSNPVLSILAVTLGCAERAQQVWNLYPAAEGGQMVLSPAAAQPEPAPTATQGQAPPQGPPPDPADRLG